MREGTVPEPLTAPALIAIMTYYLLRSYRIRGNRSCGVETSVTVQVFLGISPEPKKRRSI
jgi:hypothetical protein